jgi:hypothetical protein
MEEMSQALYALGQTASEIHGMCPQLLGQMETLKTQISSMLARADKYGKRDLSKCAGPDSKLSGTTREAGRKKSKGKRKEGAKSYAVF